MPLDAPPGRAPRDLGRRCPHRPAAAAIRVRQSVAAGRGTRAVPLTPFQTTVLRLLARNPIRWSADVDLFHDVEDAVIRASDADVGLLKQEGYEVRPDLWTPGFRRAWVARDDSGVRLEWCRDSAWRFFPIEADDLLGWKLHRFDALTNKALAMASRAETRDLVDLVAFAGDAPLHAVVWAACTKDPGFGPLLLLNEMRRNSRPSSAPTAGLAGSTSQAMRCTEPRSAAPCHAWSMVHRR